MLSHLNSCERAKRQALSHELKFIRHSRFISFISHLHIPAEDAYKSFQIPNCSYIKCDLKSEPANWTLLLTGQPRFLTSNIEVSWGGVACAIAVGGYTLILPLVWLLTHLYLQGTCMDGGRDRGERKSHRQRKSNYTKVEGIKLGRIHNYTEINTT